jgi:hypothetical protein
MGKAIKIGKKKKNRGNLLRRAKIVQKNIEILKRLKEEREKAEKI